MCVVPSPLGALDGNEKLARAKPSRRAAVNSKCLQESCRSASLAPLKRRALKCMTTRDNAFPSRSLFKVSSILGASWRCMGPPGPLRGPQGPGAGGRTHAFLCVLTRFEGPAFWRFLNPSPLHARFPSKSHRFKESGRNLFKRQLPPGHPGGRGTRCRRGFLVVVNRSSSFDFFGLVESLPYPLPHRRPRLAHHRVK